MISARRAEPRALLVVDELPRGYPRVFWRDEDLYRREVARRLDVAGDQHARLCRDDPGRSARVRIRP